MKIVFGVADFKNEIRKICSRYSEKNGTVPFWGNFLSNNEVISISTLVPKLCANKDKKGNFLFLELAKKFSKFFGVLNLIKIANA